MDQQTIDAARSGQQAAREALLRDMQDPWFRFCMSMLRDADAARDATQETALRFLSRLHQFRGESSVLTWSMGIAVNVVREMRRAKRTPDAERLAAERSSADSEHSPTDHTEKEEMRSILSTVLNDLPERQREAIVLRYFQNMSVEETAAAMNCAAGTVKATIHHALRKLRSKLNQFA